MQTTISIHAEYDSGVSVVGAELVVSNLIYSCCITGLIYIKSPQGVARCSAEDPAHFSSSTPSEDAITQNVE